MPQNPHPNTAVKDLWIGTFLPFVGLAFFLASLAAILTTVSQWDDAAAVGMVLAAGLSTLWLVFRLYREARHFDPFQSVSHLLGRLILVWVLSLRVPLGMYAAGRLARQLDQPPALFWNAAIPITVWTPVLVYLLFKSGSFRPQFLRGSRPLTKTQVRRTAAKLSQASGEILNWGGIGIPETLAEGHFAIVGATASGKTITMRLLMQSVLSSIQPGRDRRAIILDAKRDALEILSGMKLHCPVYLLNPFDLRSVAWDMAGDVTSPATALQVAQILVPDEHGPNTFFTNAARDLLGAVFTGLHLTRPGQWTLADAILTLSYTERAQRLLYSRPETRHIASEYFNRDPRTLANISSTISAFLSMLRPVAALWSRATQKISLTQWARSECILVLGSDEQLRAPMDAVNRVMVQIVIESVLAQSESDRRRTWAFLDEIREGGKFEALPRGANEGRTKGLRYVLAFQTIEGMRAVYGDHTADELAGMCANKALLRTDSPVTAQWDSQVVGEYEHREWMRSVQRSFANSSKSWAEHIVKREAVLPSEFLRLPLANRRNYTGYFVTPAIGVYKRNVHFADDLLPRGPIPNFIPRPAEHQYLQDDAAFPHQANPLDDIGPVSDERPEDFGDGTDDDGFFYRQP